MDTWTDYHVYGSRRICQQLRRDGLVISRKSIQRQIQEMGLVAIGPKPNTSRASPGHVVSPYLLWDLRSGWPNHIWGIEITLTKPYIHSSAKRPSADETSEKVITTVSAVVQSQFSALTKYFDVQNVAKVNPGQRDTKRGLVRSQSSKGRG